MGGNFGARRPMPSRTPSREAALVTCYQSGSRYHPLCYQLATSRLRKRLELGWVGKVAVFGGNGATATKRAPPS